MKILFFGDIVGRPGREAVVKIIPKWKKKYSPDFIIANGENLSHGKGITKNSLDEILKAGVDFVTSGNHIWRNKEAYDLLNDKDIPLIRPANYPPNVAGQGYQIIEVRTKKILIINLIGRVFMQQDFDDPFRVVDQILDENDEADIAIVDWHAEATSEKKALGWYLNGRVTAVIGTHTHVATADQTIMDKGTAYISDVGMAGSVDSILGAEKESVLKMFSTQIPQRLAPATGQVEVNAVIIEICSNNKAKKIERISEIIG